MATTTASAARDAASDRFARMFELFDSLASWGYSRLELFEISSPGATEALRTWAALNGHRIVDRTVSPPGAPGVLTLVVQVVGKSGAAGAHICVHRYAEGN
jgi:hypothetical protein